MFEDLKKRKQRQEEERAQLKKEAEKLTAEAAALDIRMEKAKADGDAEEYIRLQTQKAEALTSAEFKQIQSGFEDKIPLDDYMKAWEDYASKDYAKKYNTALNRLEDAKKVFLKSIRDLLLIQNEAKKNRQALVLIMGSQSDLTVKYRGEEIGATYSVFPLYTINQRQAVDYYIASNPDKYKARMVVEHVFPLPDPSVI